MNGVLTFEAPTALLAGAPIAAALVLVAAHWQRRRGISWLRVGVLGALRLLLLLVLVVLLARPTEVTRSSGPLSKRPVAILLDRSQSMGLREQGISRFDSARTFLQRQLLPELRAANLEPKLFVFDETAEAFDLAHLDRAKPNGSRTDLGSAIARVTTALPHPPLAIIALTDGAANCRAQDGQASSQMAEGKVPFLGVGFGSDAGARSINLRQVEGPASVCTNTPFTVSARVESTGSAETMPVQLLLFRDGQLVSRKTAQPGKAARSWLESFETTESNVGTHNYSVRLIPPDSPDLYCLNATAGTSVRAKGEDEFRVLYVQGALTWDYKFISLALRGDPAIKLTAISRTSQQSIFRQNVESVAEISPGSGATNAFPQTLAELSPFRVVVLSNLRPELLSPLQQELLARFCGELGGGVLLLGGPATFDSAWQGSRLEGLLPATFAARPPVESPRGVFRVKLTPQGLQNPIFKIANNATPAEAWARIPPFSELGLVETLKPGAESWAVHPAEMGPQGNRILMAGQRFGAGLSAVICIQNFWRWRLAPDSEPATFDRFWRQLLRYLADARRETVAIHFPDQDLKPESDVQTVVELLPNVAFTNDSPRQFTICVRNGKNQRLSEQKLELQPLHPVQFSFRPGRPGLYTVSVLDSSQKILASHSIELKDANRELENMGRNMECLQQWAALTEGGVALKVEDCTDARSLVASLRAQVSQPLPRHLSLRRPLGLNGWTVSLVCLALCAEWLVRKRSGLV